MPTPNFDEILEQAKQYQSFKSEQEASERTSGLIAKGFSGLVESLLKAEVKPKEIFTSYLDPATDKQESIPRAETGGNVMDVGFRKLFGGDVPLIPPKTVGLSPEESRQFAMQKALLGVKAENTLAVAKAKAAATLTPGTKEFNTPMNREVSNYFYLKMIPGLTIEEANIKPLLTYGDAEAISQGDDIWKMVGATISAGKTPLGTLTPEAKETVGELVRTKKSIFEKMSSKPNIPSPSPGVLKYTSDSVRKAFKERKLKVGDIVIVDGVKTVIK